MNRKTTKLYDLTEPICQSAQGFTGLVPPALKAICTLPVHGSITQKIDIILHFGTHLDAPFHYGYPMDISQIPLEKVYGSGIIIDIPDKNDWDVITVEDLENARPKIRADDIVIIHTGWHKYWAKDHDRYAYKYPGLGKEAIDWLVGKKVKMVGSDTISPEHIFQMSDGILSSRSDIFTEKIDRKKFPLFYAHHTFLCNNILLLEQVGGQIGEIVGQRLTVAAFPIKLVNGDGCQVRVVAIKD